MQTQLTISLSKIKLLLFIFFIQNTFSQTVEKNVILDEKVKDYFNLTRENIHLHFNKETYINNETIWFKGYVIDKASGILNIETTNVYVSLLDKEKKVIGTKLVLCNFGTFSGHWDLDKDLTSGYYYIHAFTNFMNNFKENESSLFKIKILNPKENEVIENIDILTNATIEIAAEGGNFIFECDNRIGVTIKDCNSKGIKQENIKVVDSKNNIINQCATNSEGYGAFYILNTKNEAYKILVENKYAKIEKNLPPVQIEGVTISTSNSINADQLLIEIKTNKNTLSKIKNKKYQLIFQKNHLISQSDIILNEKIKKITIAKEKLQDGINFIKLLDEKNQLVCERVIYNHPKNETALKLNKLKIENDSIILGGKIENKIASLSVSVLPSETINSFENNAITSQLKVNNYLLNDLKNYSYYFKNFDRIKAYELDIFLLSQKESKYRWQNFLNSNLIDKYEFQKGLNVKVTLNQDLPKKSNTNYTGNLIILEEKTILQEKLESMNTFNFKNVIVKDSTDVLFSLNANDENFNKQVNSVARVINSFTRVKIPETNHCVPSTYIKRDYQNLDFPQNNKTIMLKNIEVSKKRDELKFNKIPQNKIARGLKIDPEKEHLSLLQFLQKNGYNITNTPNLVRVQNVGMRRANGDASEPVIFIDDFPINDLTFLREYNSSDVDEIYFNKFDNSNQTIKGELGTIRIYLRRELNLDKIKPKGLKVNTITNGFQAEKPFLNPYDSNFNSEAYKTHGTINWIPNIYTDKDGNFEFKTAFLEQDKILLNIQGIDSEGNLYYENVIVKTKE
jgi:hypothetical protein